MKAEDLEKYEEGEKVYNPDGSLKHYPKGTFIYRLAGRDRQKSASYYTPEVLTQCLVKYTLKEILKGKTADEILKLTICEMAMGSAAFLNEVVNQLAEQYLRLKQKETGGGDPPRRLFAGKNRRSRCISPTTMSSAWTSTRWPWSWPKCPCGST